MMRNENDKAKIELKVFAEFASQANIGIDISSAKKGDSNKHEPDISCEMVEGQVYFELAEAVAPELATEITRIGKGSLPTPVWCDDVSTQTVSNKLKKLYAVSKPIELLIYTGERTTLPDDIIAAKLQLILSNGLGRFRRVWLFGDSIQCIANSS